MKKTALLALFAFGCAAATAAWAQVAVRGVTTLTMGMDIGNGVAPPAPGSRVSVPYYERVRLQASPGWAYPIQWIKDGKPIAGATAATLELPLVTPTDSGFYSISGAPWPFLATGIKLTVAPAERLTNLSARIELAAGDAVQIVGFVVSGEKSKGLLVRAVGPTLASMGVSRPVAQPRLRFFDAAGKELEFVHAAVVIDWAPIFASVGAFPLTGGEREWEAYTTVSLAPGAYTAHVSDGAKQGGTVLAEIYELP